METNTIHLWDAIRAMRELTKKGKTFSMSFMSYDKSRKLSQGPISIPRAKLRRAATKAQNKHADYMLNFLDVDTNRPRKLYQVCLMEFNSKRIIVS